jgi:CheY-like chemotaxis protein
VVEDSHTDVFLIRSALAAQSLEADLQVLEDGESALDFIGRMDADDTIPCPRLMLLDISLPRLDGFVVLEKLRESRRCARIPVIIMTSSAAPSDRQKSAALGADGYFQKPAQYDAFLKIADLIRSHLE